MQKTKDIYFELGQRNIFEEFYELIEKYRITDNSFSINSLYENLYSFDIAFQEFSTQNNKISNKIVYKYIDECLFSFLTLFKINSFSDRPIYWALIKFIQFSTFLLSKSDRINNEQFYYRNITQNFPSLVNSKHFTPSHLQEIYYEFNLFKYHQIENQISVEFGTISSSQYKVFNKFHEKNKKIFNAYTTNYSVYELLWDEIKSKFISLKKSFEMEIKLHISNSDNDASKLSSSLFLIVNSLSNIENVEIKFDDLHLGSLVAKIRLYIKDLFAKEETKALLETTKEGVIKTLSAGQISHADTKQKNADTKKMLKETELLDQELRAKPSDIQAEILNALNLEKMALENEQLRIKNANDKLELIERLSDLAQKGILEADSIQVDINGFLYLLKNNESITRISDHSIDELT